MKVAFLYPQDAPNVSWNLGRGIVRTLGRMGHEVLAIQMPTSRPFNDSAQENRRFRMMIEEKKRTLPPIAEIGKCDLVVVSGPEHVGPWIEEVYERYEWRQLGIPTAAWMHESCERDDYTIDFEAIQWMARDWFFPAIQDAERFDQEMFAKDHSHYLPFGIDPQMFHDGGRIKRDELGYHGQDFDVSFIGGLYPKRIQYLNALSRHDHPPIHLANCVVQTIDGYDHEAATKLYVEGIRRSKVFFNLPSMSKLLVPRVTEVLACGGFLLTPMLPPEGGVGRNMALIESGLMYYRPSNVPYVAQLLRDWSAPEKMGERDGIAMLGRGEVHQEHTLDRRLSEMFRKIGIAAKAAQAAI